MYPTGRDYAHNNTDSRLIPIVLRRSLTEKERLARMNPEWNITIYNSFKDNPLLWGMYYLKSHFRVKSPIFHLSILRHAIKSKFLAIAAPRESAKSTVLGFVYPFHGIDFQKYRFIVIVQNTFSKASRTLENIKKEIRDNPKLDKDFKVTLTKDSEGDSIFRHTNGFETRVLCKGAEQIGSLRGERFGAYRPDLFILDDIEDDEMVKNNERREDLRKLFDEVIVPAGEWGKTQYIVIGTILHDDSLLARLVSDNNYPQFTKLLYRARNEENGQQTSLWPERWSVEELNRMERLNPISFAKERQNDPVAGSVQRFHKSDFRYWRVVDNQIHLLNKDETVYCKYRWEDCIAAIAVDLAWEEKRDADYSVIMPGLLTPNSEILIDKYICKQGMREDEFIETVFSMVDRYSSLTKSPVPLGTEKAKLEKVMIHLLRKEERKRNKFIWKKTLMWDSDKLTRIETRLIPRYKENVIYHRVNMGDLEYQLMRFPNGTHDDLCDSVQGLVQILQFPKDKQKLPQEDDKFMKLRDFMIKSKFGTKTPFVFGNKKKVLIPALEYPL